MTPSQTNDFTIRRCGTKLQAAPRVCWEQLTCSGTSVIVEAMTTGRKTVLGQRLGTPNHTRLGIAQQTSVARAGYKTHSPGV